MLKINNKSSISDIVYFVACISNIILLEIYVLHVVFVCICTSSIVQHCTNNLVFVFVFFVFHSPCIFESCCQGTSGRSTVIRERRPRSALGEDGTRISGGEIESESDVNIKLGNCRKGKWSLLSDIWARTAQGSAEVRQKVKVMLISSWRTLERESGYSILTFKIKKIKRLSFTCKRCPF